jgi:hypothetical protein
VLPSALLCPCMPADLPALANTPHRRTVAYYRRRMQMGLAGFGYPWEDGEQAWLLHSQRVSDSGSHPKNTSSDGGVAAGPDGDLPPECLADPDSSFVDVDGVRVHYKEVDPMQVGQQLCWHYPYSPEMCPGCSAMGLETAAGGAPAYMLTCPLSCSYTGGAPAP